MCDCHRLKIRDDFKHELNMCPVSSALFCSLCKIYGHATMKCPDRARWHYRKPEFVEQFLPINVLNHYKITTKTPIQGIHDHMPYIHGEPVIEIPYDDDDQNYNKNIRATLASHNLPCGTVKENKRVMEEFGDLIGKKVVYMDPTAPRVLKSKKKVT